MKRILVLAVSLVLILVGCSNTQNAYVSSAKKHGYFNGFNVSYGMSFADCKNALESNNVNITEFTSKELGDESVEGFYFRSVYLDKNATVGLFFPKHSYGNTLNTGLYRVLMSFDDIYSYQDALKNILAKIKDEQLPYEVEHFENNSQTFSSTITLDSITDAIVKEKSIELAEKVNGTLYDSKIVSIKEIPIESIMLKAKSDGNIATIEFRSKLADIIGIVESTI